MDKITTSPIEIRLGISEKKSSLIDDIMSLSTNKSLELLEDSSLILSEMGLEKSEKKKKKKKSKKSSIMKNSDWDIENSEEDENKPNIMDLIEDFHRRGEESEKEEDEKIIKEQKGNYQKLKNDKTFKKDFAEELTILYNLLDESTKLSKDMEKDYNGLKGGKVRGISKYINDLGALVLNSKQSRLAIVKEITNIKKTIADLDLKLNKIENNGKGKEGESSPELYSAAYLKNILNYGRQDFINKCKGDIQDDSMDMVEKIRTYGLPPSDEEYDFYADEIEDRLSKSDYRSEESNKYIEYENRNVTISIKKCVDTGEWEFVALDKNNTQIYDYPLPSKRSAGRMKFSNDGRYATDSQGIMYNVIEYYLPEDDEYDH